MRNKKSKEEVVDISFESNVDRNDKSILAYCNFLYLIACCILFFRDDIYIDTKAFSYSLLMFLIPIILKYWDMSAHSKFRKRLKCIAIIFLTILLIFCISNFNGIINIKIINNVPIFEINNNILGYHIIHIRTVAFTISLTMLFELMENFSRVYFGKE